MRIAQLAPVLALSLVALAGGCKSAERDAPRDPEPAPEKPTAVTPPAVTGRPLPAEAPLEEAANLPAEATPDELERRVDRVLELLDALFETIVEHADDCDEMARSLDRLIEVNRRMIEQMRELDKHRELIEERLMPKLNAWLKRWTPKLGQSLAKCAGDPGVQKALMKLSQ